MKAQVAKGAKVATFHINTELQKNLPMYASPHTWKTEIFLSGIFSFHLGAESYWDSKWKEESKCWALPLIAYYRPEEGTVIFLCRVFLDGGKMLLQNSLCRNSDSEVQTISCSSTLSIFHSSHWKVRALTCTATAEEILHFSIFTSVYPLTIFEQLIREHASRTQTKPAHHLYTFYYRLPMDGNCPRKIKIDFGALDISHN